MIVVPDTSQFESKMALARKNTPVIWRRFSRKPRKFFGGARRRIFTQSSVSKNSEMYTPETSCMKGTSVHVKNVRIKQHWNQKV